MRRSWWIRALGIIVLVMTMSCGGGGGGGGDDSTYTVGGTVNGLAEGTSVVLQLNGAQDLTISEDGSFTFPDALANGSEYTVTIKTQPTGERACAIANGTGAITSANVTDVRVTGQLDAGFGTGGIVVSDGVAGGVGTDVGYDMAIDASGRILVVGESAEVSGYSNMVIWRYDPITGELDDSFGGGDGIVVYDSPYHLDDAGYSIALADPDDANSDILVCGVIKNNTRSTEGDLDMAIWRYDSTGTPVGAFGIGGVVMYQTPGNDYSNDEGKSILAIPDGDILVAGVQQKSPNNSDLVVWKFNAIGSAVLSFGTSGIATLVPAVDGDEEGISMALDDTGRICVAGTRANSSGILDMVVCRFTAGGLMDPFFNPGLAGYFVYNSPANANDAGNSIALDNSGRILVAGYIQQANGDTDMAIWRYLADGSALDTSFSADGIVTDNDAGGGGSYDYGFSIALADPVNASSDILVSGMSMNGVGEYDMALWRYNSNGTADTYFGDSGVIVTGGAAGESYLDAGFSVTVDSLGKILVCGYGKNDDNDTFDMIIWRFFP